METIKFKVGQKVKCSWIDTRMAKVLKINEATNRALIQFKGEKNTCDVECGMLEAL